MSPNCWRAAAQVGPHLRRVAEERLGDVGRARLRGEPAEPQPRLGVVAVGGRDPADDRRRGGEVAGRLQRGGEVVAPLRQLDPGVEAALADAGWPPPRGPVFSSAWPSAYSIVRVRGSARCAASR